MSTTASGIGRRARSSIPPPEPGFFLRPRVLRALTSATGRLVVVSAPPGYQKSSHVAHWAAADDRPTAWVTLDTSLNDPGRMLPVLLTALEDVAQVATDELRSARNTFRRYGQARFSTTVAPMLGAAIGTATRPFILVLDNVHLIEETASNDLLGVLAYQLPVDSTLVMVGNGRPLVTLSSLRLRVGIVEVSAEDLALDEDAARAVIDAAGGSIDDGELAWLLEATEGWPIGVRMAALAREWGQELRSVARDRLLSDYVHEAWLRGTLPEDLQFLRQVSCLEPLSGDVCDAVLGRTDSGAVLERLHSRSPSVIRLDGVTEGYRLHRVVRDVLDADFERGDRRRRREVQSRASQWFEQAGDIDRALEHAVGAGDLDRAGRLVAEHAPGRMTRGRYLTVTGWIDRLPHDTVVASAPLCVLAALAAVASGEGDTAVTWVRLARQALETTSPGGADATVGSIVDAVGAVLDPSCSAASLAAAERAARDLPPGTWHVLACAAHGVLAFAAGYDAVADRAFAEGAAEAAVFGDVSLVAQCKAGQALVRAGAGQWEVATTLARSARGVLSSEGLEDLPNFVMVTATSALVEAVGGNAERARADAALTRRNLVYLGAVAGWAHVQARLALARVAVILGDRVGARTLANEVEALLVEQPDAVRPRHQLEEITSQISVGQASLPYGPSSLSTAELRVLHYLPTNLTLGEIASRLFVSRNTAKSHAAAVYRKLGVTSRGEAVELARSVGLLS